MCVAIFAIAVMLAFPQICDGTEAAEQNETDLHAVIYTASWCQPCKAMLADFEQTLPPLGWRLTGEGHDITVIDIDDPAASKEHFIEGSVPQMVVLKKRKLLARRVGVMGARDFGLWLNSHGAWRAKRVSICAP